jgi:hypothetical protein
LTKSKNLQYYEELVRYPLSENIAKNLGKNWGKSPKFVAGLISRAKNYDTIFKALLDEKEMDDCEIQLWVKRPPKFAQKLVAGSSTEQENLQGIANTIGQLGLGSNAPERKEPTVVLLNGSRRRYKVKDLTDKGYSIVPINTLAQDESPLDEVIGELERQNQKKADDIQRKFEAQIRELLR